MFDVQLLIFDEVVGFLASLVTKGQIGQQLQCALLCSLLLMVISTAVIVDI